MRLFEQMITLFILCWKLIRFNQFLPAQSAELFYFRICEMNLSLLLRHQIAELFFNQINIRNYIQKNCRHSVFTRINQYQQNPSFCLKRSLIYDSIRLNKAISKEPFLLTRILSSFNNFAFVLSICFTFKNQGDEAVSSYTSVR